MASLRSSQAADLESLEREFRDVIQPLVKAHCFSCHDDNTQEAMLNLQRYAAAGDVIAAHQTWEEVLDRLELEDMPPEDAPTQLGQQDRQQIIAWIEAVRTFEANRNAGDPGAVLARRLSNAEYDYSIRDLTGVDIRPTKTFPVDPANEAGFDNSGESLSMSPALMNKYLEAARTVVEHMVLSPEGIAFAPHPVVTDTDRDKYCVNRIVDFYKRQPTDFADYFYAAWKYQHRDALQPPHASLQAVAADTGISAKYLKTVWDALHDSQIRTGPLKELQSRWQALPEPTDREGALSACQDMRDYVLRTRKHFEPKFDNLKIQGIHAGAQPFVLWKNEQYAANRRTAHFDFLDADKKAQPEQLGFELPSDAQRESFEADCQRFCEIFPDAFYISERGRDYLGKPKSQQEKGRLLSAGFHSMMGYFRDDQPLQQLLLDDAGQAELDALWKQLDFFTAAPMRQYQGFLWFERTDSRYMRDPEFDFARPEDQQALSEKLITELSEVYVAKAIRSGGEGVALQALRDYFRNINDQIRWVVRARREAQTVHLEAVVEFCQRAYRRPLQAEEVSGLKAFYQTLKTTDGLTHEEAIQDTVVAILMSPHFAYRLDLLSDSDQSRALTAMELASRLSYFLWSSVPDEELLDVAASGRLLEQDVLLEQVDRMLADDRVRALATEFGGNWLDFRRFEEHNSVDRERFPSFDDELRSAMFEEPIRFFVDILQNDRSALDFLYADHTFVNAVLAKHYDMDDVQIEGAGWQRVDEASRYGRGGVLPMSVFLTKNAPGLRTSPVKRGYWVVRRLLGEHIPPPPPDVPELPADESQLGELTLRQTLAKHRDHASCAGCHNRIDSVGLIFEGFGPIGERRTLDLGGRPIDAAAEFPDGSQREGVADLREYIRQQRQQDFIDNTSRKLLSYALGRTLLLSDQTLLDTMQADLQHNEYRFNQLIRTIVSSPQFLNKRGRPMSANVSAAARSTTDE
ncbi:hypothetical protein UC8_11770 [Roseimaritima ulvae]|uniref:Planctomycete cytochrome C n=2 Tax=Roseimaritima ulvae TaxID=980254 RepID=A0A5B9QQ99_9BACT|nr:hypothetical protein UC8_11770 [Roseimaritima ulvae]